VKDKWQGTFSYLMVICTTIHHFVILNQWLDTMVIVDDSYTTNTTNVGAQSWIFGIMEWGLLRLIPHIHIPSPHPKSPKVSSILTIFQ